MFKMRCTQREMLQAVDDVKTFFRKHPGYELSMCDVHTFCCPYLSQAETSYVVHDMVRRGELKRKGPEVQSYQLKFFYSLVD